MDFKIFNTTISTSFEIDTYWPSKKQALDRRMKKILTSKEGQKDVELIKKLLAALLDGTYIIFYVQPNEETYFVQFGNEKGNIFLDLPVYGNNILAGKEREVLELLKKNGFKKYKESEEEFKTYTITKRKNGDKIIQIHIAKDYALGVKLTKQVCSKLYGIPNPQLYRLEFDIFQAAN